MGCQRQRGHWQFDESSNVQVSDVRLPFPDHGYGRLHSSRIRSTSSLWQEEKAHASDGGRRTTARLSSFKGLDGQRRTQYLLDYLLWCVVYTGEGKYRMRDHGSTHANVVGERRCLRVSRQSGRGL